MLSYETTLCSLYAVWLRRSRSASRILTNVKWERLFLLSHLSSAELVIIPILRSGERSTKQWSDLAEANLQASAWSENQAHISNVQVLHTTNQGNIMFVRLTWNVFGKIHLVEGQQKLFRDHQLYFLNHLPNEFTTEFQVTCTAFPLMTDRQKFRTIPRISQQATYSLFAHQPE